MKLGNFKYDDWIEIPDYLPLHPEVIREAAYEFQKKHGLRADAIQVEDTEVARLQELDEFIPIDGSLAEWTIERRYQVPAVVFGYWEGTGCFLFHKE